MSTVRDAIQRESELSELDAVKCIVEGLAALGHGWRAPVDHSHDAEDAAQADAARRVRAAIDRGRAKAGV